MKQYYLLMLLCLACHLLHAQRGTIAFEYDAAGNRVLRKEAPALPVTLINFTAEKSTVNELQSAALLAWRTASETNSSHFDIQRSADGKKWSQIGSVQASGDKASDTDYSFVDYAPLDGENLYRLKMIDRDSTFTYSRLQSLDFETLIVFYPNPVKGMLRITGIPSGQTETLRIQVWDAAGKLVRQSTGLPTDGIDMNLLPTGIYMVKLLHSNGSITVRKMVKE